MDTLNEEIEGSFMGGAQDAGPGASPYHPTDLGEKIYDINTVVFNYTNFPTKRSETRNDMVHSLIKMLTKANRDLTTRLAKSPILGNVSFPTWECFVPNVGICCSLKGNVFRERNNCKLCNFSAIESVK